MGKDARGFFAAARKCTKSILCNASPKRKTASHSQRHAAGKAQGDRKRLSELEEEIINGLSQAAGIQREAIAQTNRRVQAYLYGASRAVHEVTAEEPAVGIPEEFQEEAEFQARHADHDAARRAVLQIVFEKGGTLNEDPEDF